MRPWTAPALLLLCAASDSGCRARMRPFDQPPPRPVFGPAARLDPSVAGAATAAVIVGLTLLAVPHDRHVHGPDCGCPHRPFQGQEAYWYQGRWELYRDGDWYLVSGPPP